VKTAVFQIQLERFAEKQDSGQEQKSKNSHCLLF